MLSQDSGGGYMQKYGVINGTLIVVVLILNFLKIIPGELFIAAVVVCGIMGVIIRYGNYHCCSSFRQVILQFKNTIKK